MKYSFIKLTTIFERLTLDDDEFCSAEETSKLKVKFVAPLGLRSMPRILLGLNKQCVEFADFNLVMNSSPESLESSKEQSSDDKNEKEDEMCLRLHI
jgi:hypothetical protein